MDETKIEAVVDEARLEAMRLKYGKVGVVPYGGHECVFRKPSREIIREYRRKQDSATEKPDSMDQLAQATLIAYDGDDDVNRARLAFTTVFLEEYPAAISNPKFNAVLSILSGLREEEDDEDLGKGVSVRSGRRATSPAASPNGSGASSTTAS